MIDNKMTKACVAGWRAGFGAVRKMHFKTGTDPDAAWQ